MNNLIYTNWECKLFILVYRTHLRIDGKGVVRFICNMYCTYIPNARRYYELWNFTNRQTFYYYTSVEEENANLDKKVVLGKKSYKLDYGLFSFYNNSYNR